MDYPVKILTLYKNFFYSVHSTQSAIGPADTAADTSADTSIHALGDTSASADMSESMTMWRTEITKYNGNPKPEQFLTNPVFCGWAVPADCSQISGMIEAGKYMFIQKIYTSTAEDEKTALEQKAAEELYLEALWQEKVFLDDIYYMRRLEEEDDKHVFQLFRKIQA